jgi:hypothetical protein
VKITGLHRSADWYGFYALARPFRSALTMPSSRTRPPAEGLGASGLHRIGAVAIFRLPQGLLPQAKLVPQDRTN